MHEIDLIPPDYRRARWLKVWLRNMTIAIAIVISTSFAAFAGLTVKVDSIREEKRLLEEQLAVTSKQRDDLETLDRKKNDLNQQLSMLNSLRSGAPARSVFVAIDRALADAEVWFLNWQFRRAGVMVPESQASGVETGYFIVVPESGKAGGEQAWLVETHMTITGQARDHEALSRFVNGLYAQSTVVDVRVQRTELSQRSSGDVVQFEVAVVLTSEARG
jgi:Tfp pilus assembly protein PilN